MATNYLTPNMQLVVPVVGQEPGPAWASDVNTSLTVLDSHTHAPGSGVLITPNAININADLSYNNVNNAINLRSLRFNPQTVALSNANDVGCLYEVSADLYYNDGVGNQIRITQSGSVAGSTGTITGLPSGTASASYQSVSGTFQFQQATGVAANIDGGSLIVRYPGSYPSISGSGIVLEAPSSISSSWALVLPALPPSTQILTLDTAGNIVANYGVDNSTIVINGSNNLAVATGGITGANIASATITGSNIASATIAGSNIGAGTIGGNNIGAATITGSNIAPQTITQGLLATRTVTNNAPAGGIALSAPFNSSTTGTSFIVSQQVTLTTTGRPVEVSLVSYNAASTSQVTFANSGVGLVRFLSSIGGTTILATQAVSAGSSGTVTIPPASFQTIDILAGGNPGTYVYTVQIAVTVSGQQIQLIQTSLMAREL